MLFIQSLTYAFTKQDPSTCTQYVTEESCLEPSSVFRTGEHQCLWQVQSQGQGTGQGQQGGDCVYVTPDNSIEVVVFVAIFSALATTPIALLVDWIINVILVAPTASDSDEVRSKMKERKYALSSFRSSFSTSFSLPRLVPVVPASEGEHKDDDVNRMSMDHKVSHDEDKIRISLKAREEFEEMRSALLRYRERTLHTTDLEEFNRLWGLTEDGQFRVIHLDDGLGVGVGKTHSIERIIEREIVELHYSLEKELLRFQEGGVGGGGGSSGGMGGLMRDAPTRSFTIVGDVNKDGVFDVLIGYPLSDVCEVTTSTTSEVISTITVNGKISTKLPSKSQLGWATAAAGDLNLD
ncbi:hypothetical protein LTR94_026682, partial [Friedmanniomyces endolithicus]